MVVVCFAEYTGITLPSHHLNTINEVAMTKQTNILSRSKAAENRVVRYLFGEDATRDWKETHDISGVDSEGNTWIGEVKNYTWVTGPATLWTLLYSAFEQAEGYSQKCFAIYIPKNAKVENALVMVRMNSIPVVMSAEAFKNILDGGAHEYIRE